MLVKSQKIRLNYDSHKAELEIVLDANAPFDWNVEKQFHMHIGVELPSSRFFPKPSDPNCIQADNGAASLAFVGERISTNDVNYEFSVSLNGEHIRHGSPNYKIQDRVDILKKEFGALKGYLFLGNFLEPFQVKRGDVITVDGSTKFSLYFY